MTRPAALPLLVLTAAACVLGLAPILVRLTETGPAAAGFWRLFLALPLLLALNLAFARRDSETSGSDLAPNRWMFLAGGFFALDLGFWHYGITLTSVANATVLCNLTPVVVTAVAWIAFRERPGGGFLIALAVALAGAFAMAAGADPAQGRRPLLGDLLSLAVSFWYAGYFLAVKAARKTASALKVMLWSTAAGAPLMLVAAVLFGEDILPVAPIGWLFCGLFALVHVAGQTGVTWALGRLPAGLTALVILIQPLVAALFGWLLFAETLTVIQALGGVLVLAAVAIAQWTGAQRKTGAETTAPAPAET
ncbi:DMT family transporter [Brevundimonas balnearis]|uniref:DMT family transporter n=1 Tax=Brevundimonas balnearis TaxID=1572858 RepID=A0ABV6R1W1_9CAUL